MDTNVNGLQCGLLARDRIPTPEARDLLELVLRHRGVPWRRRRGLEALRLREARLGRDLYRAGRGPKPPLAFLVLRKTRLTFPSLVEARKTPLTLRAHAENI